MHKAYTTQPGQRKPFFGGYFIGREVYFDAHAKNGEPANCYLMHPTPRHTTHRDTHSFEATHCGGGRTSRELM